MKSLKLATLILSLAAISAHAEIFATPTPAPHASSSLAKDGGSVGSGNNGLFGTDQVQCDDCPVKPIPVGPTFEQLDLIFTNGTEPKPEDLTGSWINVLKKTNKQAPSQYTIEDNYNIAGILNADGSMTRHLTFSTSSDPFTEALSDSVTLQGLGDNAANQGPNQVSFHEQKACFAQYAYNEIGILDESAYFTWECRFTNPKKKSLLCAFIPGGSFTGKQSIWIGKTVHYLGFFRAPDGTN